MSTGLLIATAGRLETATTAKQTILETPHVEKEAKRCPHCESVIYSRRFSTCRDCGGDLPTLHPLLASRINAEVESSRNRVRRLNSSLDAIQPIGTFTL